MGLIVMGKQVQIYALTSKDLKVEDGNLVVDTSREFQKVDMGNVFFIKCYLDAMNLETDFIDSIVKVFVPTKHAKKILLDGFYMNNKKYIAYTSTPSLQKKETVGGKGEFLFIEESKQFFIDYFERLISLDKFEKEFDDKKIAIAKKVTSRTALAFSDVTKINCFNPRIIVVKNHEYPISCTIDTVDTTGEGENRQVVLNEAGRPKIIRDMPHEIMHTCNDGMGLMSPTTAQAIKESMQLEYDVYFAVIRGFMGLAIKGMCMTFDYVSYFEEYNKDCDGEYGCYTVVDAYDKEQDIRECDLLLTTSQAKWWANFKDCGGMDEVYSQINKIKKQSTKDMVSALYVTKVNKNPAKLSTHCLTNYQLIGNLNLTYDQYKKLSEPTFNLYKGVIDGKMDYIKTFLKDFVDGNTEQLEDDGEITQELDTIQPSTIAEGLLNCNQDFYKFSFIKNNLGTLVNKKRLEIASGRIYVSGCYTYLAQDPIFMLNKLIGIETRGELEKDEYYCAGLKKEWLSQRCPCNSFNEIVTFKTITNNVYDKYLSHLGREMVVYNAKSLTLIQQSTADVDGDAVLLSDDETLIGGVVKTKSFFYNLEDGQTKEEVYNRENKLRSLYETSGNLIGQIAIKGGVIANRRVDFEEKLPLLYLTLLMQQIAIDCPKSGVNVPKSMIDLLDSLLKKDLKPYFMRWAKKAKDRKVIMNTDNYIAHDKVRSVLDKYADYVMKNLREADDSKDGNGETNKLYAHIEMPDVKASAECSKKLQALYNDYDDKYLEIKEHYKENNAEDLERLRLYKEEMDEVNKTINGIKSDIEYLVAFWAEEKHELELFDSYQENLWEEEEHRKEVNKDIRNLNKKLEPQKEILRNNVRALKAETALKAKEIVNEYGEDVTIRSLVAGRENGKDFPLMFVLNNFYDSIIKYIPCKNAYKLLEVERDTYDFEHLGHKYIRKQAKLEDSHIVVQNIVANQKAAKKVQNLGITVEKTNMGFHDADWCMANWSRLKGKELKIVVLDGNVQLEFEGINIGWLYTKVLKDIDMKVVEKIKVIDIQPLGKVFKGKNCSVWFEM